MSAGRLLLPASMAIVTLFPASVFAQSNQFLIDKIWYSIVDEGMKTAEVIPAPAPQTTPVTPTVTDDVLLDEDSTVTSVVLLDEDAGYTLLTTVVIPETVAINGSVYTVTGIQDAAFLNCNMLESVVLPPTVTRIGKRAFFSCTALEMDNLPESLTEIGDNAFSYCSSLTFHDRLLIGSDITSLGYGVFSDCKSLKVADLSGYTGELPENLLNGCTSLRYVTLNEDLTQIPAYIFYDCSSLNNVNLPESLVEIGERAFSGCSSMTLVSLPLGLQKIDTRAFSGCMAVKEIEIPREAAIEVGEGAFEHLESLNYAYLSGVRRIEADAFAYCKGMTWIEIEQEMEFIGTKAFTGCNSLEKIYIHADVPPVISINTFDTQTERSAQLLVKVGARGRYLTAAYWSRFSDIVETENFPLVVDITETTDNQIVITTFGNSLTIESNNTEAEIYAASGELLAKTYVNGSHTFTLPHGLYIVTTKGSDGKRTRRIIL